MYHAAYRGIKIAAAMMAAWTLWSASAGAETGQPVPWQIGMQPAVTPIAEQMIAFHDFLLYITAGIVLFVFVLLAYVMVRFNKRANQNPTQTTHNTLIEVLWTVVPILILLAISVPSFRLLFAQYDYPEADLVIKATGHQWYWSYEYPDHEGVNFDAVMVEEADLKQGQPRLLATDNDVVVPVNKNVHVLVTASDVIHNWTIPAFGSKIDAVPGRILRTWFRAEKEGMYYGQCSELCGQRHAYMPIAVKVVSEEEFEAWLQKTKGQARMHDGGSEKRRVADLAPRGSEPDRGSEDSPSNQSEARD